MNARGTLVSVVLAGLLTGCNLLIGPPGDLLAGTVELPRTGQTRCYEDSGPRFPARAQARTDTSRRASAGPIPGSQTMATEL